MNIYFLEKSVPFNGNDLNSNFIGGTEKTLINISNELAKRSELNIKVFNGTKKKITINNVEWINLTEYNSYKTPDVLISFSDMGLFKNYRCKKKFLWSHSVQSIEKFIRKKQLLPYFLHRPILILEGDYHHKNRSFLTSIFGKKIIKLAPDYEFINETVDINHIPEKKCIFTTKSDRNLNILIKAWNHLYSLNNDAKLLINPPINLSADLLKKNIQVRNKGEKKDLIRDLKSSKIMLVPGHKGEVFCLAAEEARELCLPIITLGYGSLYERVEHNKTGFIAKNLSEFVNYSHKLLNDNELYLKLRTNLFKLRNSRNYINVADDLLSLIRNS